MHGLQLPSPAVQLPSPSVAAPRFACAQRSAALRAMAALTRIKSSSITTARSSCINVGWKRESLVLLSLAAPDRTLLLSGKTLQSLVLLSLATPNRMSLGRAWRRTCARRRCWRSISLQEACRQLSACRKLAAWWGKPWLCVIGRGPGNTSRHSATPSRGTVRWCWPSLVWWSASMKPWAEGVLKNSDTDVVWAAPGSDTFRCFATCVSRAGKAVRRRLLCGGAAQPARLGHLVFYR